MEQGEAAPFKFSEGTQATSSESDTGPEEFSSVQPQNTVIITFLSVLYKS